MAAAVDVKGPEFHVGVVQRLFQARVRPGQVSGRPYDVSADGKRFLVITLEEPSSSAPITVVTNWMALLKR